MNVRELISALSNADPESVVVFLDEYADRDESYEICEVVIPTTAWTHERGVCLAEKYEVRYPGGPREPDEHQTDLVRVRERVVVLSTGPTNLRFIDDL